MEKGFLGIELGEKILRFVYVAKQRGTYVLIRAGQLPVNLNFNSVGSLTQAVRSIIEREELVPQRVFVTISRRDTLIHQQVMPKMSASELEEVVPGEIEKIPFFYNQPFEFCYKTFPYNAEKERVILVAIAENYLRSLIEEVDAAKLFFRDIEVSPLNLKDIFPEPRPADRCEAVLVVQELCSYFCIYKGAHYLGFYRSPVGAEQIMSPVTEDNRDQVLSNWVGEFERVVKSHALEEPNAPIEHLWLVGDKSVTDAIAVKLSKRLEINGEVFSPEKINGLKLADYQEWNPAYTFALTPILFHLWGKKPLFPLDHFFANFRIRKYMLQMALKTVIFLFALVFGMGGLNYFVRENLAFLETENKKMVFAIETLRKQNKDLFSQRNDYMTVRKKLLEQAQYVQEINRTSWTSVLAGIANELPSELSLTGFKAMDGGKVHIKGETFDITTVADLIRKIDQSAILEKGKFEFLKEKKQKEVKLFNFGINANLKAAKDTDDGKEKD